MYPTKERAVGLSHNLLYNSIRGVHICKRLRNCNLLLIERHKPDDKHQYTPSRMASSAKQKAEITNAQMEIRNLWYAVVVNISF